MVVLVLVVVWVLALTPYALRRLGEWQVSSELNRFRRGLGALGQFSPDQLEPFPGTWNVDESLSGVEPAGSPARRSVPARAMAPQPSRQLVMRRRRTLTWLVGSLGASFVLGAIPWFRPLWDLSVFVLVLTLGYLAALVYVRRQSELGRDRVRPPRATRPGEVALPQRAGVPRHLVEAAFDPVAASGAGAVMLPPVRTSVAGVPPLRVISGAVAGASSGYAERPAVVAMPRRPAFVLVEAPS
jgi:hypothetical protein